MDEVSHLLLQPAVHHVRLTRPRPSRVSICQGRLQFPVAVARCGRTVAFVKVGDTLVNEELIRQGLARVFTRYCDRAICEGWDRKL